MESVVAIDTVLDGTCTLRAERTGLILWPMISLSVQVRPYQRQPLRKYTSHKRVPKLQLEATPMTGAS